MDGRSFDSLARSVAARAGTRRGLFAALAAAVGAGPLGSAAAGPEAGRCRSQGKYCSLDPVASCEGRCRKLSPRKRKRCLAACPSDCEATCCSGHWRPAGSGKGRCAPAPVCPAGSAHTCAASTGCGQDANGACTCVLSTEGALSCGSDACYQTPDPCADSAQCVQLYGQGFVCQAAGTGCCGQRCVVPCGSTASSAGRAAGLRTNGRGD